MILPYFTKIDWDLGFNKIWDFQALLWEIALNVAFFCLGDSAWKKTLSATFAADFMLIYDTSSGS